MKSTDELKSEIYIHTQGIINERKRGGKMTAGIIISRAREEMKLPLSVQNFASICLADRNAYGVVLFLVRHCVKEYFTVPLFENDFHPREWVLNKVYNNYLIQEPVYV